MRRYISAAALAAAASVLVSAADATPKLVVLVAVDQMRADYIDRFGSNWTAGLHRLVQNGAVFTQAAYPYLTTVTCAGHATLSTGAYPHTHGIFSNTWFDRSRNAVIACTDDAAVTNVSYGGPTDAHNGPGALKVPALADQIRGAGGHVVTLALKARSAIMLAGHGSDATTWVSETLDSWETSTQFSKEPVPQVKAYVSAHPMSADFGKVWTRLLPESQYKVSDAGLKEDPPKGWSATFPHPLSGNTGATKADAVYFDQWQHSPFADEYVANMAAALIESEQLGKHAKTDFLGVSFSSPDLVGHAFGPDSQEVQDMYARLDRSVGVLLDALDRQVGAGNYVLALSADHGVTSIPEQITQSGHDGGRIGVAALLEAGNAAARATLGPGKYLSRVVTNEVYFEPGMYDKVKASPATLAAVVAAVSGQPGVRRVFTAEQLAGPVKSTDPELRAAMLSYVPGRSGDIVISPKAGWMVSSSGTTHGSANPDDQHIPLVLFGARIKPGRYATPASPADIAPTLATLAGVKLPTAEGAVLKPALK
ncbi:MAG: alkaline phosphatase family protein [Vicinamibacterales bacterium]